MDMEGVILHECGCFADESLGVKWPCAMHRGETAEVAAAAATQQADEADAMNNWIGGEE